MKGMNAWNMERKLGLRDPDHKAPPVIGLDTWMSRYVSAIFGTFRPGIRLPQTPFLHDSCLISNGQFQAGPPGARA